MSCVSMKEILEDAFSGGYAIPAFNTIDYATSKAIIDVAEELGAPIIMQASVKTIKLWGHAALSTWYRELATSTRTPVVLHLDHCKEMDFIAECVRNGWTSVMIDGSSFPFEENVAMTQRVSRMVRPAGISLEAELGQIGGVEDDIAVDESRAHYTEPEQARDFLSKCNVDLFAPNIGTAHGIYKGEPRVDFDLIEQIAGENDQPLALHGGSGLSEEVFKKAISKGCAKVNISTSLKQSFINAYKEFLQENPAGYEPVKVLAHQQEAVRRTIAEHIELFGAAGKV